MKYAIISDIHANLTALELVLGEIRRRDDVDQTFCLGDLVGFHTRPAECIDLLRENNILSLTGNHDAGVSGRMGEKYFPKECWEAILWTREQLSPSQIEYLRSLPAHVKPNGAMWLMHGIFNDLYHYMVGSLKPRLAALRLKASQIRLGFFGHTHRTVVHRSNSLLLRMTSAIPSPNSRLSLDDRSTYLINPGSVGQPRTSYTQAKFLILDLQQREVEFVHLEYDYAPVVDATLSVFPRHERLYNRFSNAAERGVTL